jgi:hypothetical protein
MTDWLPLLREIPEGVAHAAGLVAGLDEAFSVGFGRLGAEQLKALDALGRTFAGTPLARPVAEALASVRRSEFVEQHFVALAAARASLQGAQHDALSAQAARALVREASPAPPARAPEGQAPASHHEVWLESARQWLMEIAIAGLLQLGPEALLPFAATLENLQSERALVRPAALLTGLFNELVAALPIGSMTDPPVLRWIDLWSRAMILAAKPPPAPLGESVTGELSILGVDMRSHANFASAVAYGFLSEAGKSGAAPRLVRATVSSFKVDVLTGSEVWGLFKVPARTLLAGMAKRAALKVQGMTLLSTGDLIWDDKKAEVGGAASAMAAAEQWLAPGAASTAILPAQAALDRHPAQIAEPVLLTGYRGVARSVSGGGAPELVLATGSVLPIATERAVSTLDFGPDEIAFSQKIMGLLRFNAGRWALQPLALAMGGKKPEVLFAGARGAAAAAGGEAGGRDSALGTLRERAGKLLRAKS